MITYHIAAPEQLKTIITLPASKSITNRALIINALSGNKSSLANVSDCDDTYVMTHALSNMPDEINIMAAGTAMRFLTAYLSVTPGMHVLTGTERMLHRPIGVLVDALRQLGAQVEYVGQEGFPPLRVTGGELLGGQLQLPGNISSQYISALLMIAPIMQQGLTLCLTGDIISRPYIDMTLSIMQTYGAKARWVSKNELQVLPQPYAPVPYVIENDWSAAGYWYQMVALSRDPDATVILPGLFEHSIQGDAQISKIFQPLGVRTDFTPQGVRLTKTLQPVISRLELDMAQQPDMAQTVVATCLCLGVHFRLTGLQSLRIKETDRIAALEKEFAKLGFVVSDRNDSEMMWGGERCVPQEGAAIDTYEDHRMAMALGSCAFRFGTLRINNPQVVSKSYPHFWRDMYAAGCKIIKEDN